MASPRRGTGSCAASIRANGEAYCVISIYLDERVFRMAPRRFRRETVIPVLLELPRRDDRAARGRRSRSALPT